jgi:hypothetical protein
MTKVKYPHNGLRHQLTAEEKRRFNAYKKRECERRRRYERSNRNEHKNYLLHRCEACRKFFQTVQFLYGYSVCFQCPLTFKHIRKFLKRKDMDVTDLTENDIKNNLKPPHTTNTLQEHTTTQLDSGEHCSEDTVCLVTTREIEDFLYELNIIQAKEEFDQLIRNMYPRPPSPCTFELNWR